MLSELRVENLLLIERAELRFERGLNAITGETGAGKTVLAHALDLLLGGKPRSGIVRPGADEAYVEGVFEAPAGVVEGDALAPLRDRIGDLDGELVLARRVGAGGRTRAFVQGRSASAADLAALGARLVSFYGQHEHRRLTLSSAQLEILDGFCGGAHLERLDRYRERHATVRSLERALAGMRERVGSRERDQDLLAFELEEIDSLAPSADDYTALDAERRRLSDLDGLRTAAHGGAEALAPETSEGGVIDALAAAEQLQAAVAGADPTLDGLAERLRAVRIEAEELARELRDYGATLEADPERLERVEARLAEYERLKRKHGGDIDAVLAHAERCRGRLAELEGAGEDMAELEAKLTRARGEEADLAEALGKARRGAAQRLSARVRDELAQLAMEDASFTVSIDARDELGVSGGDRVEFLIAPNPGVPATPLRETASGGELSRAMLALLSAAGSASGPTLVFDEVDAGIGGQTARAVGERLRALAEERQVICITHLPQIASLAERHFRIWKRSDGRVARTAVDALGDDELVGELCRMLGADASDPGARRHAEELRALAA